MPITKNSDDYIDRIRKDFKDHYGVEITEKAVREILKQFQSSLKHYLKQGYRINFPPYFTIYPVVPLTRACRIKYYGDKSPTSKKVKHLLKVARQKPAKRDQHKDTTERDNMNEP